jgi:hypothetical protein
MKLFQKHTTSLPDGTVREYSSSQEEEKVIDLIIRTFPSLSRRGVSSANGGSGQGGSEFFNNPTNRV